MKPSNNNQSLKYKKISNFIPYHIDEDGNLAIRCSDGIVAVEVDDFYSYTDFPHLLIDLFDTFTVQKGEKGFILFFRCPEFRKSIEGANGRILARGESVVIHDFRERKILRCVPIDDCTKAFLEEYAIFWILNSEKQARLTEVMENDLTSEQG